MSGRKSKRKGSSFEREIAKFLSDEYGEVFTRTPSSGAYTGGSNATRRDGLGSRESSFVGDITIPDNWDLVIECKNYADLDFNGIIAGHSRQLDGWLSEIQYDARTKFHLLFFKISRRGTYVAIPVDVSSSKIKDKILKEAACGTLYLHTGTVYWILPLQKFSIVSEFIKQVASKKEVVHEKEVMG